MWLLSLVGEIIRNLLALIAVTVEPIPGLDTTYDIAVPLALIRHSFTFFQDAYRVTQRLVPRVIHSDG